jgi:hypothetical protein
VNTALNPSHRRRIATESLNAESSPLEYNLDPIPLPIPQLLRHPVFEALNIPKEVKVPYSTKDATVYHLFFYITMYTKRLQTGDRGNTATSFSFSDQNLKSGTSRLTLRTALI